ncbi:MAG: TlpA family protein disulfide reductase [Phycisphaerae bacterium]
MRLTSVLTLAVALALFAGVVIAQGTTSPASRPTTTTAPYMIPDSVMKRIEQPFAVEPATEEAAIAQMETVLKLGADAEKRYERAGDLYKVQLQMLEAAGYIASVKKDPASRKQVADISARVLASNAPDSVKVQVDFGLALNRLQAKGEPKKDDVAAEAQALYDKYEKTDAAAKGAMMAAVLGLQMDQGDVAKKFASIVKDKYLDVEGARGLLRQVLHPDKGQPFAAELTTLDGKKLSLPKDLLGKVVVIDFWATWCPPCREEVPFMKKMYAAYKAKGVEFVGVSLDQEGQKDQVARFVKEQGMDWPQTYAGRFWDDPTAKRYGVDAIPSLWIIGKDGKVIVDGIEMQTLEELEKSFPEALDKALKGEPTTKEAR